MIDQGVCVTKQGVHTDQKLSSQPDVRSGAHAQNRALRSSIRSSLRHEGALPLTRAPTPCRRRSAPRRMRPAGEALRMNAPLGERPLESRRRESDPRESRTHPLTLPRAHATPRPPRAARY